MTDITKLAKEAEAFETPSWAVDAILKVELLTHYVVDPCAGRGVLGDAADAAGYEVIARDKYDWGAPGVMVGDFFTTTADHGWVRNNTVLMNPPFSLAEQFVEKCFELGARKIICFQRFAWWESAGRRDFWEKHPPNRIYICGNRASCWRFDIPEDKRRNGTTTAHAWFVWSRGHPAGTTIGHIWKGQ